MEYIIEKGLEAAYTVAKDLSMPLLVTGEPGTGKTQLAYWIARQMGGDVLRFNTKTTSVAKDLFYSYDTLRHFRKIHQSEKGEYVNTLDFISFGPLGRAILEGGQRPLVVLVDEIDKAPRDFTNDLLYEFEEMEFRIDEATPTDLAQFDWEKAGFPKPMFKNTGEILTKAREKKPFLLMTSNSEKNLPDAFLRRCAFYHIAFPNADILQKILLANGGLTPHYQGQVAEIVRHFEEIRSKGLRKLPATAELEQWTRIVQKHGIDLTAAATDPLMREKLLNTYPVLAKNKEDLDKLRK